MMITYNIMNNKTVTFTAAAAQFDINKVVEMLKLGYSDTKISKLLGVSQTTISNSRKRLGISPNNMRVKIDYDNFDKYQLKALIDEGNSLSKIGKILGINISTVRSVLKHFGLKTYQSHLLSIIDEKRLIEMLNRGMSQKEIAKELSINDVGTLTPLIKKFGIKATKDKVYKIPEHELRNAIEQNLPIADLAQKHRVSYLYLLKRIKELNMQTKFQRTHNKIISEKDFRNDVKNGMSARDIASKYDISITRVRRLLKEFGISIKKNSKFEKNYPKMMIKYLAEKFSTVKDFAEELNISQITAYNVLKRYGIKINKCEPAWKSLSVEEISTDINKGLNIKQIAHKYKVKLFQLYIFLKNNNLKTPYKLRNENL